MKKAELIIQEINDNLDKPLISPTFGDNWKKHIKGQFNNNEIDIDSIIDIAWKQGRRALLLENALLKNE